VDVSLNESEWKKEIKSLLDKQPELLVGILSGRISDTALVNSYIMDAGVMAGVILLRQGVKECSNTMLKVLEANEARGRRKYLRYTCSREITLNFSWDTNQIIGNIVDISSVGLSCSFEEPIFIAKNQVIPDVQLKLGATLITTDCIALGSRVDPTNIIYVFIYRTPGQSPIRSKVRYFINKSLQQDLERDLTKEDIPMN
jgi:hypothetical protein